MTTTPARLLLSLFALTSSLLLPLANAQPAAPAAGVMDIKTMTKDMNDKMSSMPMTGNADVDFAMMMRVHHQGAIDMARAELANGKDAKMRGMAGRIIAAQKKEIAQFDNFLAKHGNASQGK